MAKDKIKTKKTVSKGDKKGQFPQISRFFPAQKWWRIVVITVVSLTAALFIFNLGFLAKVWWENEQAKQKTIQQLSSRRLEWEAILARYPDYRDAYFQLATIEYQLNNKDKAKEYLVKTLEIDPNFQPGLELKNLLGF